MLRPARSTFNEGLILRDTLVRHVEYHQRLTSTNATAFELLDPLVRNGPSLVITDEQTAGRGRKGNAWWSGIGALTFSMVLDPDDLQVATQQRPLISLVAGMAVRDAISQYLPNRGVSVKWPNDVLVDGQKICGILAEQHSVNSRQGLIIGIGINVNNSLVDAPPEVRTRATSMFDLRQISFDLTDVLIQVLKQLDARLRQLQQQPMQLMAEANHHHLLRGQVVTVQVAQSVICGLCIGIDDNGSLVLRDNQQLHRLTSGIILNWTDVRQ